MPLSPELASEIKELGDGIQKTIHDLRDAYEKKADEFGERAAAQDSLIQEAQKEYEGLKDRLDSFEAAIKRPPSEVDTKDAKPEDLVQKYATDGFTALTTAEADKIQHNVMLKWVIAGCSYETMSRDERKFALEYKASVLSDDTNAGYLAVPNDMASTILGNIREKSPIRQLADVRSGSARAFEQPRRTGEINGAWVGEVSTRSETTGHTVGMEVITAHEHYAQIHVSRQMASDSAYDLDSYFRELASEAFELLEATAFVNGDSVGKPEGITTNGDITTTTSATAATIAADDLSQIPYDLKEGYRRNSTWLVHRTNHGRIRILKDGSGRYLWEPSLQAGEPARLLGFPIMEATDLSSTEATSSNVALFGDFRANYRVYDRLGMTLLRDPFTAADTGTVKLRMYRRIGGGVVLPEAMVLYQLS